MAEEATDTQGFEAASQASQAPTQKSTASSLYTYSQDSFFNEPCPPVPRKRVWAASKFSQMREEMEREKRKGNGLGDFSDDDERLMETAAASSEDDREVEEEAEEDAGTVEEVAAAADQNFVPIDEDTERERVEDGGGGREGREGREGRDEQPSHVSSNDDECSQSSPERDKLSLFLELCERDELSSNDDECSQSSLERDKLSLFLELCESDESEGKEAISSAAAEDEEEGPPEKSPRKELNHSTLESSSPVLVAPPVAAAATVRVEEEGARASGGKESGGASAEAAEEDEEEKEDLSDTEGEEEEEEVMEVVAATQEEEEEDLAPQRSLRLSFEIAEHLDSVIDMQDEMNAMIRAKFLLLLKLTTPETPMAEWKELLADSAADESAATEGARAVEQIYPTHEMSEEERTLAHRKLARMVVSSVVMKKLEEVRGIASSLCNASSPSAPRPSNSPSQADDNDIIIL